MGHIAMTAVEAIALLSPRLDEKHGPTLPAQGVPGRFQTNGEPRQFLGEPDPAQRAHHVRRHNDTGADVRKFRRLLVHGHIDVGIPQENRGGEPPEAAADDRDSYSQGTTPGGSRLLCAQGRSPAKKFSNAYRPPSPGGVS